MKRPPGEDGPGLMMNCSEASEALAQPNDRQRVPLTALGRRNATPIKLSGGGPEFGYITVMILAGRCVVVALLADSRSEC